MKTEKDDRKVEKSYLIENWLTLNKTPFSQWKTETQHKNLLLMCLEIFEEMETELRKEKIPVKMDFREIAEDKEILCTCQVQAAVCALFYVLVCEIHPVQVLFSGKDQTLSFTATGGTGETERKADNERLGTSRWLALQYLQSVGYDVKISRSGKKELISVTFQTAGKAVRNRYDSAGTSHDRKFRSGEGTDPGKTGWRSGIAGGRFDP